MLFEFFKSILPPPDFGFLQLRGREGSLSPSVFPAAHFVGLEVFPPIILAPAVSWSGAEPFPWRAQYQLRGSALRLQDAILSHFLQSFKQESQFTVFLFQL
jgi:hypothetical protein